MKKTLTLCLLFLLVQSANLCAQKESGLSPVTNTYALKDVRIIQKPGQMIEVGTVIVKDGLIHAVGTNVEIPANAKVLEADSMYVYAGFIDGLSHIGIPKPESKEEDGNRRRRESNSANPTYERAGIQPEIQARDVLSAKNKSIAEMRKLGFTAAHSVPRGKMLPGNGALILLSGETADEMVLKSGVSLFSQFKGGGGVYPGTLIAVMSKFRELYGQAEQAKAHKSKYANNQIGLTRPNNNRVLEAFYPVIDGKIPVYYEAPKMKDMHRVFTLQKELGFPLVLSNLKQGWYLADKIKSTNTKVLLSLDLPDVKDEEKKNDKDKKPEKEGEVKFVQAELELAEFKKRQQESLKMYRSQAATFETKGIQFGFSSMDAKSGDIRKNLRTMIKNGLSENAALAALTTNAAQQLGVSNSMGTVEKGKIANLVVSDKPYFAEKSNVRFVVVDGKVFEYEVKKKKKGDPNAKVDIAGSWTYEIFVPGMEISGVLTLKNEDGEVSGSMTMAQGEGSEDIRNAVLDGDVLTFESTATPGDAPMKISFELTVDGESIEGTVNVGEFGTFEVKGDKVPE
ncbi:MAG: imidazolonepropionase-like amidohydrolase [Paraglaciecola sp.]|jgi:imidazolonepropionase-like amidohydrolase